MKNLVTTEIAVKTEILSSEDGNRTYRITKVRTFLNSLPHCGRIAERIPVRITINIADIWFPILSDREIDR